MRSMIRSSVGRFSSLLNSSRLGGSRLSGDRKLKSGRAARGSFYYMSSTLQTSGSCVTTKHPAALISSFSSGMLTMLKLYSVSYTHLTLPTKA